MASKKSNALPARDLHVTVRCVITGSSQEVLDAMEIEVKEGRAKPWISVGGAGEIRPGVYGSYGIDSYEVVSVLPAPTRRAKGAKRTRKEPA